MEGEEKSDKKSTFCEHVHVSRRNESKNKQPTPSDGALAHPPLSRNHFFNCVSPEFNDVTTVEGETPTKIFPRHFAAT